MAKILVTGAHGLLGTILVPRLRERGHSVVTCSRHDSGINADLTDMSQAFRVLSSAMPDTIVNLAACTNVEQCEQDLQLAYTVNVKIVEHLARWIRTFAPQVRLVQLSTDQVYNGHGPHSEDKVTLINHYAFSKYAGELAALSVGAMVIRTNFVGASRSAARQSLSDWVVSTLRAGQDMTVFEDILFSPLSMDTLSSILSELVGCPSEGVFNLGSREGMSKADFAYTLAQSLDLSTAHMRRGSVDRQASDVRRPGDMRMDVRFFEKSFGIELPTLRREIQSIASDYAHSSQ